MRAVRATIVVPGLFALTYKVIGDTQMTLFATFGGFAEGMAAADTVAVADTVVVADTVRTRRPQLLWVHEHLHHLRSRVNAISGPATRLAEIRQQPWWR